MIRIKRAYDPALAADGRRFLVDGLWPRGLKKEILSVEGWVKGVAPSRALCDWFGHDPVRWTQFARRYEEELDRNSEAWKPLLEAARAGDLTLVFAARDVERNNAVVLRDYLERRLKRKK